MNKNMVLIKTPKGKEEIETRQYRLSAKQRGALILVDGKSDVAHLVGEGRSDWEKELIELISLGFIESMSAPIEISTLDPKVAAPQENALAQIKAELIRISGDILGIQAVKIVKKIENSPESKEALSATVRSCIELVRLIVDEQKSKVLEAKYRETLRRI